MHMLLGPHTTPDLPFRTLFGDVAGVAYQLMVASGVKLTFNRDIMDLGYP